MGEFLKLPAGKLSGPVYSLHMLCFVNNLTRASGHEGGSLLARLSQDALLLPTQLRDPRDASRLTVLENDANAKGFVLIARKAHAALRN
jgi:hypothetical protein